MFDAVQGGQQLRLFNAHYDEYGFQPIVVFDGEGRFITAVLRPAKRPSGKEIKPFLRRLLRAIRAHWPNTEILLRADSHYCGPEVLDLCRASGLDYILGVAPTTTLRRHVEGLEASRYPRLLAKPCRMLRPTLFCVALANETPGVIVPSLLVLRHDSDKRATRPSKARHHRASWRPRHFGDLAI